MKSLRTALLRSVVAFAVALAVPPSLATAERSPIFGSATVQAMSDAATRDITARGFWANHFGSAAVSHAYNAYVYAFYARNYAVSDSYTEQAWYSIAMNNAYYAYLYSYYAMIYSQAGI